MIVIPTAHVYGKRDTKFPGSSAILEKLCVGEKKAVLVHEGGHPIPGSASELSGMVRVARRAIHWGDLKAR
jgi:hypothetical protein